MKGISASKIATFLAGVAAGAAVTAALGLLAPPARPRPVEPPTEDAAAQARRRRLEELVPGGVPPALDGCERARKGLVELIERYPEDHEAKRLLARVEARLADLKESMPPRRTEMKRSGTGPLSPATDWRPHFPPHVVEPHFSRSGGRLTTALAEEGSLGKWSATYPVKPGAWYEFRVEADTRGGAELEPNAASVVVSWRAAKDEGGSVARDYLEPADAAGSGRTLAFSRTLRAPEGARYVEVELILRWQEGARVTWKRVAVTKTSPPKPRVVRIATTRIVPGRGATKEKNAALMFKMLDKLEPHEPDLVLFSENLLDRGVGAPVAETAEPVPGPFSSRLAERARRMKCYIATTIHEKSGRHIYNTGFIVGRNGELVGKYRKVHLPLAEAEKGILPGSEYPVFDLDFGKVGMMICWDNWFPEPARILRLKGAEILLFPLAGDGAALHWEHAWRARAIDNGVYLVSSSTGGGKKGPSPSRIVSPTGEVLAGTRGRHGFALADLDLNRRYTLFWLSVGPGEGEAKSLYVRERRPATYGEFLRE